MLIDRHRRRPPAWPLVSGADSSTCQVATYGDERG